MIPYSVRDTKINIDTSTFLSGADINDNYLIKVVNGETIQTSFIETSVSNTSTSLKIYIPGGIFSTLAGSIETEFFSGGSKRRMHLTTDGIESTESTNGITITSDGRVGIGIVEPEEDLEIDGSVQIDSANVARLKFQKSGQTSHALGEIDGEQDGTNGGDLQFYTKVDGSSSVTEKLRINNVGAIGIGGANFGTSGKVLTSNGSGSAVSWSDQIDTTYTQGTGVSISPSNVISIGQSVGTSDSPSFNALNVNGITLNGTLTCSGSLNPSTDSGIGSAKTLGASSSNRWNEIYCFYLYYNSGGQFSDDRVKHNEKNITNGLDVIAQLVPKKYQKSMTMYDADYNGEIEGIWDWESGLIAQELLNTDLSWCVRGGDRIDETTGERVEELYSVDYNSIFTYNIRATQELHQIVQQQEQRIAALEARIN